MQLIKRSRAPVDEVGLGRTETERLEASLEELIRRARVQASDLSLLIQRLEHLRSQVHQHLYRNAID